MAAADAPRHAHARCGADGVEAPSPSGPPRQRVEAAMTAVHDAMQRDPWLVQALAVEGLASPRILPVADAHHGGLTR